MKKTLRGREIWMSKTVLFSFRRESHNLPHFYLEIQRQKPSAEIQNMVIGLKELV